jgi:hypothetical protein
MKSPFDRDIAGTPLQNVSAQYYAAHCLAAYQEFP